MPADDFGTLVRDWSELHDYVQLLIADPDVTIVERQELADALERIEKRFEKFDNDAETFRKEVRGDITAIRTDINRIQGMARLAAWVVTSFGGILAIAGVLFTVSQR